MQQHDESQDNYVDYKKWESCCMVPFIQDSGKCTLMYNNKKHISASWAWESGKKHA